MKVSPKLALLLTAASITLATSWTAPALAQDAGTGGGDIIVTARRVEERLQDVPISITVFNQEQLANRNIVNSSDLASYTPSLSVNKTFGNDQTTFTIRGFFQDPNSQPSVGVFFADVVAPRGASNNVPVGNGAGPGSFFDLQNVQVLKGPQGTLFGRNTTGGDILLLPQKPTTKLEGFVEGSYGTYDMARVQGVINIPLSDIARFRIGVDHYQRDGYVKNTSAVGPRDFEDANYTAARASLVVDLTPDLENYTIVSYSRSHNHGPAAKLVACNPNLFLGALFCPALARNNAAQVGFYDVQNTVADPKSILETWQIINTTTWQASDTVTLKNIASYAQLRLFARTTLFGIALDAADLGAALGAPIPSSTIPFASTNPISGGTTGNQSTFTDEFQIQAHSADNRFTLQAGGYLEVSDPLGKYGSQSPVFIQCSDVATLQCTDVTGFLGNVAYSVNQTNFRNHAVYAQASYSLTDKLKVTGGMRYTWDKTSATGRLLVYNFPLPNTPVVSCTLNTTPVTPDNLAPCDVAASASSHKPTWLIDVDYKPSDDILIYAKWARGYRAGGTNLQAPETIQAYSPEKVDTYEGGLKASFRGTVHGYLNIAAFYNTFTNQQLPFNLVNGNKNASATLNVGKSRIYGAEVEAMIAPFEGFTLEGAYTYLNTKLQEAQDPVGDFFPYTPVSVAGNVGLPLLQSPKNQYTVTGTYTLPLDSSVGRVSIAATFTHTDKQLSNYTDKDFPTVPAIFALRELQPRNLLNLNLNWKGVAGSPIDLSLFATNVTNQKYYAYVPGNAPVGAETANLGEPRMFGGRIRYSFGG